MKRVLIFGATSDIAQEAAKRLAASGASIFLVGRNEMKLDAVRRDLQVRGASSVEALTLDLADIDEHRDALRTATERLGGLDGVLIAHGVLPNQQVCERSVEETIKVFHINCLSVISLLTLVANHFEAQRRGCIAVITSVAGDRGRKSNYAYGATKAALNVFLQGMRNRLYRSGVSVVTVKPGLVDSPMTTHLPKNALFVTSRFVGEGIYRAMVRGRDEVYLPGYWKIIMAVVRGIPERIFKKLNL
jgi:short-subunit dehydrogenase